MLATVDNNHKTDKKVTCQVAQQKLGRTIGQSKMESSVNKVTCQSAQHKRERCKRGGSVEKSA